MPSSHRSVRSTQRSKFRKVPGNEKRPASVTPGVAQIIAAGSVDPVTGRQASCRLPAACLPRSVTTS
jgi:hypothetical protein